MRRAAGTPPTAGLVRGREFIMRRSPLSRLLALAVAACALAAPAVDAAGPKAYVGNFSDNTVSVVDLGSGSVVATIPVSAGPHGMTVSPDGKTVYISGDGASNLDVIDTATDRVRRTIEIGKSPHGLAMTPDGKTLLAAIYGEDKIAFIDIASLAVVGSVSVPKPHTIAIRPDGSVREFWSPARVPGSRMAAAFLTAW